MMGPGVMLQEQRMGGEQNGHVRVNARAAGNDDGTVAGA